MIVKDTIIVNYDLKFFIIFKLFYYVSLCNGILFYFACEKDSKRFFKWPSIHAPYHCYIRFISRTAPTSYRQAVQYNYRLYQTKRDGTYNEPGRHLTDQLYSTITDYTRQNGTVHKMNRADILSTSCTVQLQIIPDKRDATENEPTPFRDSYSYANVKCKICLNAIFSIFYPFLGMLL